MKQKKTAFTLLVLGAFCPGSVLVPFTRPRSPSLVLGAFKSGERFPVRGALCEESKDYDSLITNKR